MPPSLTGVKEAAWFHIALRKEVLVCGFQGVPGKIPETQEGLVNVVGKSLTSACFKMGLSWAQLKPLTWSGQWLVAMRRVCECVHLNIKHVVNTDLETIGDSRENPLLKWQAKGE